MHANIVQLYALKEHLIVRELLPVFHNDVVGQPFLFHTRKQNKTLRYLI